MGTLGVNNSRGRDGCEFMSPQNRLLPSRVGICIGRGPSVSAVDAKAFILLTEVPCQTVTKLPQGITDRGKNKGNGKILHNLWSLQ